MLLRALCVRCEVALLAWFEVTANLDGNHNTCWRSELSAHDVGVGVKALQICRPVLCKTSTPRAG